MVSEIRVSFLCHGSRLPTSAPAAPAWARKGVPHRREKEGEVLGWESGAGPACHAGQWDAGRMLPE